MSVTINVYLKGGIEHEYSTGDSGDPFTDTRATARMRRHNGDGLPGRVSFVVERRSHGAGRVNAGQAINAALRADRRRQFGELLRSDHYKHHNRLLAWWWWGWNLNGRGGLGYPGSEYGQR